MLWHHDPPTLQKYSKGGGPNETAVGSWSSKKSAVRKTLRFRTSDERPEQLSPDDSLETGNLQYFLAADTRALPNFYFKHLKWYLVPPVVLVKPFPLVPAFLLNARSKRLSET